MSIRSESSRRPKTKVVLTVEIETSGVDTTEGLMGITHAAITDELSAVDIDAHVLVTHDRSIWIEGVGAQKIEDHPNVFERIAL